jgi:hypothetical protein
MATLSPSLVTVDSEEAVAGQVLPDEGQAAVDP